MRNNRVMAKGRKKSRILKDMWKTKTPTNHQFLSKLLQKLTTLLKITKAVRTKQRTPKTKMTTSTIKTHSLTKTPSPLSWQILPNLKLVPKMNRNWKVMQKRQNIKENLTQIEILKPQELGDMSLNLWPSVRHS